MVVVSENSGRGKDEPALEGSGENVVRRAVHSAWTLYCGGRSQAHRHYFFPLSVRPDTLNTYPLFRTCTPPCMDDMDDTVQTSYPCPTISLSGTGRSFLLGPESLTPLCRQGCKLVTRCAMREQYLNRLGQHYTSV